VSWEERGAGQPRKAAVWSANPPIQQSRARVNGGSPVGRKGYNEGPDGGGLGAASTEEAGGNKWRKKEAVSNPGGEPKGCRRDPGAGPASLVSARKVGRD